MSEVDSTVAYRAYTKAAAQALIAPYNTATNRYGIPYLDAFGSTAFASKYYSTYLEASRRSDYVLKFTADPLVCAAPVITGVGSADETLTATNGVWRCSTAITFSYQWTANDEQIPDETAQTILIPEGVEGQKVRCVVIATSATGEFALQASNSITIS
tara:strand:+ start:4108 stop:4581 length:474 start_codon:yes stop_codon:yes gene_type:complete